MQSAQSISFPTKKSKNWTKRKMASTNIEQISRSTSSPLRSLVCNKEISMARNLEPACKMLTAISSSTSLIRPHRSQFQAWEGRRITISAIESLRSWIDLVFIRPAPKSNGPTATKKERWVNRRISRWSTGSICWQSVIHLGLWIGEAAKPIQIVKRINTCIIQISWATSSAQTNWTSCIRRSNR